MEAMFYTLMEDAGFRVWWESEDYWGIWETKMIDAGFDADEVAAFFSQLAEDL